MTAEVQSVLEYADYRFVLNNQKQLLKEKTLQHLRYSHNGGNFNIDSTLISMTKALVDSGEVKELESGLKYLVIEEKDENKSL